MPTANDNLDKQEHELYRRIEIARVRAAACLPPTRSRRFCTGLTGAAFCKRLGAHRG